MKEGKSSSKYAHKLVVSFIYVYLFLFLFLFWHFYCVCAHLAFFYPSLTYSFCTVFWIFLFFFLFWSLPMPSEKWAARWREKERQWTIMVVVGKETHQNAHQPHQYVCVCIKMVNDSGDQPYKENLTKGTHREREKENSTIYHWFRVTYDRIKTFELVFRIMTRCDFSVDVGFRYFFFPSFNWNFWLQIRALVCA